MWLAFVSFALIGLGSSFLVKYLNSFYHSRTADDDLGLCIFLVCIVTFLILLISSIGMEVENSLSLLPLTSYFLGLGCFGLIMLKRRYLDNYLPQLILGKFSQIRNRFSQWLLDRRKVSEKKKLQTPKAIEALCQTGIANARDILGDKASNRFMDVTIQLRAILKVILERIEILKRTDTKHRPLEDIVTNVDKIYDEVTLKGFAEPLIREIKEKQKNQDNLLLRLKSAVEKIVLVCQLLPDLVADAAPRGEMEGTIGQVEKLLTTLTTEFNISPSSESADKQQVNTERVADISPLVLETLREATDLEENLSTNSQSCKEA